MDKYEIRLDELKKEYNSMKGSGLFPHSEGFSEYLDCYCDNDDLIEYNENMNQDKRNNYNYNIELNKQAMNQTNRSEEKEYYKKTNGI